MSNSVRIAAIDALLPQTQCGKCGHPGCQPYAEGIAAGEAINKCPPGGTATIHALAALLQVPELPLALPATAAQIAVIREAECIGCTKCIQACPVDAIVGAAKLMHTVVSDECSGCELCIAPCPVDCIDLISLTTPQATVQRERADQFRSRHQSRLARLARDDARRRAARAKTLNAPGKEMAVAATAGTLNDDDQAARLKRLKIEASLAKIAYEKIRKQVARHPASPFAAQLDALQRASEQAAAALQQAQKYLPPTISVAPGADEAALKRVLVDKAGVSLALRQLKTDLAYARADVSRLQRSTTAESDTLNAALERLATAERRLQAHNSAM